LFRTNNKGLGDPRPFLFAGLGCAAMNKAPARAAAATRTPLQYERGGAPTRIVCAALALALLVLVVRIAASW